MTLADDVIAWTYRPRLGGRPVDPAALAKRCAAHPNFTGDAAAVARYPLDVRKALRRAERVSLEDGFVRDVVNLSAPGGFVKEGLVERALGLARAPFATTWLEWSADAMADEQVKIGTLTVADDRPPRLGYLIESNDDGSRWKFTEWVAPPPDHSWCDAPAPAMARGGVSTMPLSGSHPHLRRTPGGVRININSVLNRAGLLVGNTATTTATGLTDDDGAEPGAWAPLNQVALDFDELNFAFLFDAAARPDAREQPQADALMLSGIENDIREMGGVLHFVVFALALVNCAAIEYRYAPAPAGRHLVAGRPLSYMSHRTVRIVVPPGTRQVTRYLTQAIAQAHRRAHQVRGHWRAAHVRRGRTIDRQWVRPHVRGDAALGFVDQDHVVATA